jgi:ketosteroid isomerase-like protein
MPCIAVSAVALAPPVFALEESEMDANTSSEREVERLERAVGEAITGRDGAALDRLIADDFVLSNPLGRVMTKKEAIDAVTSPGYELDSLVNEEIRVRVFGVVAVATALGTARGSFDGRQVVGRFRYLRVWVKREGRWQAVAAQSTNISPP